MYHAKTVLRMIIFGLAIGLLLPATAQAGISIRIDNGGYRQRPPYYINPYPPEPRYYYNRYGRRYLRNPPDYQDRYGKRFIHRHAPRYVLPVVIEGYYGYRPYRPMPRAYERYRHRRYPGPHH